MKRTGVIKYIDVVGRIKIPMELCETFDIDCSDFICFSKEGKKLKLTKYYNNCIFCNSTENILEFKNKKICINCINKVKFNIQSKIYSN